MARFYPIYARRSDGKLEVVGRGKRKEFNQPTDDQLDQKPDRDGVSDYYREVSLEEPKHMDWRRKLGGMLARELQWKDKSGNDNGYILVNFPENYRLYEHVKKTERDGKLEVKNKTHAAGGNDRQDAYLYGHPEGRRKRFRSPNDFFPHLLWLCTDESGDPDNCSCKLCCPEELEQVIPGAKVKMERTVKSETDTTPMVRQPSAQSVKVNTESPRPAPAQPARLAPTPLPAPKTQDQALDRQYNGFLYRAGEVVWFQRGQAWGIGAVLRRWFDVNFPHYTIQPLSWPSHHPPVMVKQGHKEVRPWLAWSVPKFLNVGLNDQTPPPRFETADWPGMLHEKYGNGDMEVDGSILSAKMIDSSYTPFGKIKSISPEPGVEETHYDGVFLGAEKIWCGEPVRLRIGTGTDIMVIHHIVELKRCSGVNQQVFQQAAHFVGDIYQLASAPHTSPTMPSPASPTFNPHLPDRLTRDLEVRNSQSIKMRRMVNYWKLMSAQQRVEFNDVKGRWYEASIIMPIIHPQLWQQTFSKGEVQETSLWMNSRGDCLNSNRPPHLPRIPRENNRKETRRHAFDKSVPQNTEITDGVAPPPPESVEPALSGPIGSSTDPIEIDPRFETADDSGEGNHGPAVGGGLDDFMNLDGMDHDGGFGPQYDGPAPNNGYF